MSTTPTVRLTLRLVFALVLALSAIAGSVAEVRADDETEVTVRRGDTLSRIAKRAGVTVANLRKWNRGRLKGDMVKPGMKLRVKSPEEIAALTSAAPPASTGSGGTGSKAVGAGAIAVRGAAGADMWADSVVVRKGDSAGKIAQREAVTLRDLLKWNQLTERSKLKAGQHLIVWRPGPKPKSASVGRPTAGTLTHGEKLEPGPGYRLRFPKHTFAVEGVVKSLRVCAKKVKDQFPGTADLLIGELSRAGGGHFSPHQSHQSGRDADVGYYLADNTQNQTLHRLAPTEIDFNKTWALLRCYLTTDEVSRVYMDKAIQAAFAEWLRQKKAMNEGDLERLFGVLGGDSALIVHAKKHDTHFHVRFSCDKDQPDCVEEEDEGPFKL